MLFTIPSLYVACGPTPLHFSIQLPDFWCISLLQETWHTILCALQRENEGKQSINSCVFKTLNIRHRKCSHI